MELADIYETEKSEFGFLFRKDAQSTDEYCTTSMDSLLIDAITSAIGSHQYTSYSFRIGVAASLDNNDVPEAGQKQHMMWEKKSEMNMVYLRVVRETMIKDKARWDQIFATKNAYRREWKKPLRFVVSDASL